MAVAMAVAVAMAMAMAMAVAVSVAVAVANYDRDSDAETRWRPVPGTPCNDAYFKLIGVLGQVCRPKPRHVTGKEEYSGPARALSVLSVHDRKRR
jgi:hypothetical protein